jgi:trk system potassium uptake protein TrkH
MIKINKNIGPTKTLLISLILVILIGAFVLKLPVCNKQPIKTIDSIFVATSATCVTGLTTIVPIEQFTIIGQVILLALIQIGGIGFMTLISIILITIGKKLNLSDKIIIKESLNQESFKGLAKLIKKICIYTFILEAIGACILAIRFIPEFGLGKGLWFSAFHSISAFCNAGFDLLGNNSISRYSGDWIVCLTLMLLIIIGGLGFSVWDDIVENIKNRKKIHQLTTHTKLVLLITTILLVSGTIFTLILEWDNEQIMKNDGIRN